MKRKALGKGLSSLIPEKPLPAPSRSREKQPVSTPESGLLQIDLDLIHPTKGQPREQFDQERSRGKHGLQRAKRGGRPVWVDAL